MKTINDYLRKTTIEYGNNIAVVDGNRKYKWSDICELASAYADYFFEKGVRRNDHVGIIGFNGTDWICAFFGLAKLGAVSVLYNVKYTEREIKQVIDLSDTTFLYWGDMKAPSFSDDKIKIIEKYKEKHCLGTYDEFSADEKGICTFIFTSGSTAHPKCVMLSNESLINNAINVADKMEYSSADRICVSTPLFHIFSLCTNLLSAMCVGASLIIPESINSKGLIETIESQECTILNGVPTSYMAMIYNTDFNTNKVRSVRRGLLGGAKVNQIQIEELIHAFPNTNFMINYGSTEVGFACNTDKDDPICIISKTAGRPMKHAVVKIVDINSGNQVEAGLSGEIVVSGSGVMNGYYGRDNNTGIVDTGGFVHTGDIGFFDDDQRLVITGRINNTIIRAGENISPYEIEKIISEYEPVKEAVVIGLPCKILGEKIAAAITLKNKDEYDETALRKLLKKNLARYKIPDSFYVLDELPLSVNGKIDYTKLKTIIDNNNSVETR